MSETIIVTFIIYGMLIGGIALIQGHAIWNLKFLIEQLDTYCTVLRRENELLKSI